MKFFPRAFLVLLLTGCFQTLTAQDTDSSEIITVTVDIIAKNRSEYLTQYPKTKREEYYVIIDLTNTQDTVVKVAVMTCSWSENFTTSGDSLYLKPTECDSNFPVYLKIPSHKSARFYATLVNNKQSTLGTNRSFKIGFVNIPMKYMPFGMHELERTKKYKTYWSKPINLAEKLNTYIGEIE